MRAILSNPKVRMFYLADSVSTLGDYALWLALAVWVKLLTGSTSLAGLTTLMLILGGLLAPLTGVLVDRVRRRPLMIWTYVVTGVLLASLLAVHSRDQIWMIYTVTFLYGVSGTITNSAFAALRPQIVPDDLLAEANGLLQALNQGLRLVTPLLGVGLLAVASAHVVVLVDVASFLVAAVVLAAISLDETAPVRERQHWSREVGAGFAFLGHHRVLRRLTIAFAIVLIGFGMFETVGIQIVTVGLHHAPTWVGILVTIQGIGGIIGGLSAAAVARRIGEGALIVLGLGMVAVLTALVGIPSDAVVLVSAGFMGVALPWAIVGEMTLFQRLTPNALLGRVMGAQGLATQVPQSIGIALGAVLVAHVYYRELCFLIAGLAAISALYLASRETRKASGTDEAVGQGTEPAGILSIEAASAP